MGLKPGSKGPDALGMIVIFLPIRRRAILSAFSYLFLVHSRPFHMVLQVRMMPYRHFIQEKCFITDQFYPTVMILMQVTGCFMRYVSVLF